MGVFISYGFEAHTHVGIKSIFNQHFVKTALVSMEMGKLHSNLFNKRQEGDYQDFQIFTEETIRPLMLPTRQLIEHLQTLVK